MVRATTQKIEDFTFSEKTGFWVVGNCKTTT